MKENKFVIEKFDSTNIGEIWMDEPLSIIRWYMYPILFFCRKRYNKYSEHKIYFKIFRGKFYLIK